MQTREQLKANVARIRPDATLTIKQKCDNCPESVGVVGMRSYCSMCMHGYTSEELRQITGDEDTQSCGHAWSHFREEDILCAECEGTGTVHIVVTMRELAYALWRMQPSLDE